jgi:hypothetical protein
MLNSFRKEIVIIDKPQENDFFLTNGAPVEWRYFMYMKVLIFGRLSLLLTDHGSATAIPKISPTLPLNKQVLSHLVACNLDLTVIFYNIIPVLCAFFSERSSKSRKLTCTDFSNGVNAVVGVSSKVRMIDIEVRLS